MVMADVNDQAGQVALQKALAIAPANATTATPVTTPVAIFVKTDVSKEADIKALVDAAEKTFGNRACGWIR